MAIAYKSAGSGVSTEASGAALSPLCPAVVDANDILIAHVYWEGTATAPSTPSGWTLLDGPRVIESTIARMWIFGKIADGTEDGSSVAFGAPAVTTQRAARIYSFSGFSSGIITDLVRGFSFTSHATDPQMPTVTTTVAGGLAVACMGQNDNNTSASATGETGGDWVESVAEYVAALTPGLQLQLQTATPTANPGTISGGSVATTNDPCGVIGFEIRPSVPSGQFLQYTQNATATMSGTATRRVARLKTLSATVTVNKSMSKVLAKFKTQGATATISGAMSKVAARLKTLSASATVSGSMTKGWGVLKTFVATLTVSGSMVKGLGTLKTFTANVTMSGAMSKAMGLFKTFEATMTISGLMDKVAGVYVPPRTGAPQSVGALKQAFFLKHGGQWLSARRGR